MPDDPMSPAQSAAPATSNPDARERHVTEPEIHQDLLDPDDAAPAGTPGRDENAPGFIKPAQP